MKNDSTEKNERQRALQRPRRLVSTGVPWSVDLRCGSALHESGIVISFTCSEARGAHPTVHQHATSLDMCWAPNGGPVWTLSADTAALADTLRAFEVTAEPEARRLLATLVRDAEQAWLAAWTQTLNESPAAPRSIQRHALVEPTAAAGAP